MSDESVTPEVVDAPPTPSAEVVQATGVEPPEAMLWRHFRKVGLSLAGSGFVPTPFQGKPDEIMAALAYGHELGLGPMQSLQSFDVIQGKPTLKPETMRALIRAAGHTLVRTEATNERVTWYGKRRDTGDEETVTFTIDDAQMMGLLGKDNWRKMPRAMLSARGMAEIGRSLFSDVLMGASYTPEEMGDTTATEPEFVEYDEPRKPAVRIVTNDARHAGHAVRSVDVDSTGATDVSATIAEIIDSVPETRKNEPTDWGWHNTTGIGTGAVLAVCNRCTHLVEDHSFIRHGCSHCACNYALDEPSGTMKTVGSANPGPSEGEGEPAGQPVNDALNVEGAPPTPPVANVAASANPARNDVGSGSGQTEVQPATSTSHPAGPSADPTPPAPLPNPASEGQFRAIHAAMRDNGLGDDARHTIIEFVTGSRTNSSREITSDEAGLILNLLGQVRLGRLGVEERDSRWQILVMDESGRRFLESIERGIVPQAGAGGIARAVGSQVASVPDPDLEEVF